MDAKLINSTTDLTALVPGLRRHGRYHIGPCPFCGGDDRFTIKRTDEGDLWICRRCGDGKYHDAVAFRMRAEGRSFKEVTADTRYEIRDTSSERGGRSQSHGSTKLVSRNSNLVSPPSEAWQIGRLQIQKRMADFLWRVEDEEEARPGDKGEPAPTGPTVSTGRPVSTGPTVSTGRPVSTGPTVSTAQLVWRYLRRVRGLLPETIRRYMLGYNPRPFDTPEGIHYPVGIYIPCMAGGQLWYVKARLPVEHKGDPARPGRVSPKYMALRGSGTALFNANALVGARGAVVVEGEFDALLLGQFLPDRWAAVTMGGARLLPDERFLPYFSGLERLLLCLDNDDAGRAAQSAWRGLLGWAEDGPPLPPGVKDVTEFWRKQGDIRQWLNL